MQRLLEIGLSNSVAATLLAIVAYAVSKTCRRPALAHGLWLLVLLRFVTPPLVPVPVPWFQPEPAHEAPIASIEELVPAAIEVAELRSIASAPMTSVPLAVPREASVTGFLPASWSMPILLIWTAGAVYCAVRVVRSIRHFQRLLKFARLADTPLQDVVRELAAKLGITRVPRLWLVPGKISPMLWAFGKEPRIVCPADLLHRLSPEQRRTILMHELAHWIRRDHWVRFFELTVACLYWWHPAAWWARAELHDAEEECCDAWVIGTLEDAEQTYATALLEAVMFTSDARLSLPASASGIGHVAHLRRRLAMIMTGGKRRSLTWAGLVGLALLGLVLLPIVPTPAQEPEKTRTTRTLIIDSANLQPFQVHGEPSADQEAQELLKRALKLLAEKKTTATFTTAKPVNPEEVQKARDQVAALSKHLDNQRKELAATEAKLREAQVRLAAMHSFTPAQGVPMQFHLELKPDIKFTPAEPKMKVIEFPKNLELRLHDGKATVVPARITEAAPSPDEMRQRLDRLMKEAEDLRRVLDRTTPTAPKKN